MAADPRPEAQDAAYVDAWAEGFEFASRYPDIAAKVCFPPGKLKGDVVMVALRKWVERNPDWEKNPRKAVSDALSGSFPCGKSGV